MGNTANDQINLIKITNKQVEPTEVLLKNERNFNKQLIVRLDLCLGRIKECNVTLIYNIPFFFPYCHCIPYLIRHISSHIYAQILLIFHPFLKTKQAALVASKHSKCGGGDVKLFTLSESSRYRPVRTRFVTSKFLDQKKRRNGTETCRRRSCQCEHFHLITHEKLY